MRQPAELSFGTGIYSFPAATKLLTKRHPGLRVGTLRYWMKTGLTPPSFGKGPSGSDLLSFHDLVSLELVRRFREKKVSLRKVRRQVEHIRGLGKWNPRFNRWKGATDAEIVRWCGGNDHVFVTQDDDSRSRALRMGVLSAEGVAVIFVSPQPQGSASTNRVGDPSLSRLAGGAGCGGPGYTAWIQPPNGRLRRLSR